MEMLTVTYSRTPKFRLSIHRKVEPAGGFMFIQTDTALGIAAQRKVGVLNILF